MIKVPKLTTSEYLSLLVAICRSALTILGTLGTALFRGSSGAPSYKRHVLYSALRTITTNLSIRQTQALTPSTIQTYQAWMKKKGFDSCVVELGNETSGCWVGDKEAETVILWFHGGGYVTMATDAHMELLWNIILEARRNGKNVACFVLQYDMAPGATYPRQLSQAATALQYLTRDLSLSLSQIIIGGDSAGGHLTLALLSHMLHQYPDTSVPTITAGEELFRGICLLSPVVTFDRSAPSFSTNAEKDVLALPATKKWSAAFLGNIVQDYYTTPLNAPDDWWRGIPGGKLLVLTGKDELLVDDIEQFVQKIKVYNENKVEVLAAPGECHDAPLMEIILGLQTGEQTKMLYQWISSIV